MTSEAADKLRDALVALLACPDLNWDCLEPKTIERIEKAEKALDDFERASL